MLMLADIQFDRVIERDVHYISPGGYEFTFSNGITACFDFMDYWGFIDTDNPSILHCEMRGLDDDTFANASFLRDFTGSIIDILEFFIYTGEYDEPDINPIKLVSLELFNDHLDKIDVDIALLEHVFTSS